MSVAARVAGRRMIAACRRLKDPTAVQALLRCHQQASAVRLPDDEGGRELAAVLAKAEQWMRAGPRVREQLEPAVWAAAEALDARLDATAPRARPRADIDN